MVEQAVRFQPDGAPVLARERGVVHLNGAVLAARAGERGERILFAGGGHGQDDAIPAGQPVVALPERRADLLRGASDGFLVGAYPGGLHGLGADEQGQRFLRGQAWRPVQEPARQGRNHRLRALSVDEDVHVVASLRHADVEQRPYFLLQLGRFGANDLRQLGQPHTTFVLGHVGHQVQGAPQPLLLLLHGAPPAVRLAAAMLAVMSRMRARSSRGSTTNRCPAASSTRVMM